MEIQVGISLNATNEIAAANYPNMRLFQVALLQDYCNVSTPQVCVVYVCESLRVPMWVSVACVAVDMCVCLSAYSVCVFVGVIVFLCMYPCLRTCWVCQ